MSVLLVGAGPMAQDYAKTLNAMNAPFQAVGRGARSAASFAKATGQVPFEGGLASYLEANSPSESTRAIVAVPIPMLAGATQSLIEAGIRRILVEKPAGLDANEIDTVARSAREAGADVFVAYNRRFYGSVAAARALIGEDGGVTSFHMEFTELAERVLTPDKHPAVLANWFLANSSHVIDLAFHLAGEPVELTGEVSGRLPWHPAGAVFCGHGRTARGALFTWHADWGSAGRWGIDLRTRRQRLLLQPLEKLQVQEKSGFALHEIEAGDRLDNEFKPGLYRQVQAFLSDDPAATGLPTIAQHAAAVRDWMLPILAQRVESAQKISGRSA